jgi:hypothetical protein
MAPITNQPLVAMAKPSVIAAIGFMRRASAAVGTVNSTITNGPTISTHSKRG